MTGRLTDGQLFAAVFACFLAAETAGILIWHHHRKPRRPRQAHHWPYDWKQDDPHLSLRSHVRLVRAAPPASGLHRDAS